MDKTNVTRLLDIHHISYRLYSYDNKLTSGEEIAAILKENVDQVFKTLVTIGSDKEHYVFCIPVNASLDLKKAAKAVNVKSIEMIPQKNLLPLTGYIHGGCSPIGMKKAFSTIINDTAILFDKIFVSAGKVGFQIEINADDLKKYISANYADVIKF